MDKNCNVCHRAKQQRDKFSVMNDKTVAIFELIHCDLWGPYRTIYVVLHIVEGGS